MPKLFMIFIWLFMLALFVAIALLVGVASYGFCLYLFRIRRFLPLVVAGLMILGFNRAEDVLYVLRMYSWEFALFAMAGGYFLHQVTSGKTLLQFLLASVTFALSVILSINLGAFLNEPKLDMPQHNAALDVEILSVALSPLIAAVIVWWRRKVAIPKTE